MSQIAIFQSLIQLFTSIDSCIERKVQLPTLILIYAGIDSIAWLGAEDPAGPVGERFTTWIDRYLLAAKPLACSAADLYSARCGILHTLTADSKLISKGRAKHLAYAWGNANARDLQRVLDQTHPGECVVVHISELAEALRLGTARMFEEADRDTALAQRLVEQGKRYFVGMNPDFTPAGLPPGLGAAAS